ncbi:cyclopropane-fatty-acyl-phospholipid synthase family protein [Erythrobacter sp. F6033]|uniref:SAM-dependent methyltransferase n=1 Tax=Erythrobacter sp. F6033 TaxID=2926401 RepID=UPI001FF2DDDF|nr:cyclopropane-fatty-acyl-phospholipid synthase family protein [Erythrobacter sp. F6033]MCK0128212.1 cyclopropane-fatty-acyl-phospholipid synthase family protein [Erythrobacter sp. F6033]
MATQGIRGEELLSGGERFAPRPNLFSRLFAPGFKTMLDRVDQGFERGSITAKLPDGTTRVLGGRAPGFDVHVDLKDWRALLRLATSGSVGWYQAYEAGEWEADNHAHLFALMSDNARTLGDTARSSGLSKLIARVAHYFNRNDRAGSVRNISAHYDLGNDFYRSWLDDTLTYSSALGYGADGLQAAQFRKLDAIVERLGGAKSVLEIGCGWGALAERIAGSGADVTAISLSDEQLAYARENRPASIAFDKRDYRDVSGQFDAIASVEMVEALGREYWPAFLDCVAGNLKTGGRAAIQYISMADDLFESYANSADFIQAYVFPGGMLIKSAEFRALAEARGLEWRDQTDFGLDYAATLKEWRIAFDRAVAERRLPEGFDERFIRLWRYYLSYCEGGFLAGNIDVHQVTLVKA